MDEETNSLLEFIDGQAVIAKMDAKTALEKNSDAGYWGSIGRANAYEHIARYIRLVHK